MKNIKLLVALLIGLNTPTMYVAQESKVQDSDEMKVVFTDTLQDIANNIEPSEQQQVLDVTHEGKCCTIS